MRKRQKARAEPKIEPKTSKPVKIQTQDAFQNPMARTGAYMPNLLEATNYQITRFTWNWKEINTLYREHWVIRRIIDTVPGDMLKSGYKILSQLKPEQQRKLKRIERQTKIMDKIEEGLCWGRLYGGAVGLILIRGHEDILDQPLEFDDIMPGSFKGMLVMDRWSGVSSELDLIKDISDPDFGLPEYYRITVDGMTMGIRVHHSRICRFTGRNLPYIERLAEQHWGSSELEHVIEELRKRDNVSWNTAMLTFMANIRTLKMEGLGQMLATGNEKALQGLYATIQAQNALLSNNGLQLLGENDDYQSHQYSFSGLGEVYDRFMMDVAGAAEIPVTRLFGRSPAGMNSTGESDMQNYYDAIEQKQKTYLQPVLDKILPIMLMSEFGGIPDDFDYAFNPVRQLSDSDMVEFASKNTDSVTKAFTAGLISQKVALKELRQQSEITGMWTNITDEDIEAADDEVFKPDEVAPKMPLTEDADFKESDHPRDDDGKFGSGGGENSGENTKEKLKNSGKNGIIKSNKTAKELSVTKAEAGELEDLKNKGWKFDFSTQEVQGYSVKSLRGDNNRIEGLVSTRVGKDGGVEIKNMESAPHNKSSDSGKTKGDIPNVSGRLIAEAIKESFSKGGDYVHLESKDSLKPFYEKLGFINTRGNIMTIWGDAAKALADKYS